MVATINADTTNGVVITSDTSGEIELQANGVTKAKITANGLQDANGASLRGGSFRNLIINGDMNIAQRGDVTGVTSNSYGGPDRFRLGINTAGTWTMSQDTDVPSGQGFSNSAKLSCTTADASLASGDFLLYNQRIEGQNLQHLKKGTSNAESLTISFWIKSNKTGIYNFELNDSDNTRHITYKFTIDAADTWEKKTVTFDGDTVGTLNNDNGNSLQIYWWLAAGSTYTSGTTQTAWGSTTSADRAVDNVNLADSTSNYINITGCQLEIGEGASDFEFLPYDVQLARCQRYYWKWSDLQTIADMAAYSTTAIYGHLPFGVTMRAAPTMSVSGAADFQLYMAGVIGVSGVTFTQNTDHSVRVSVTASSARTQGHAGWLQISSGAGKYIDANAEL